MSTWCSRVHPYQKQPLQYKAISISLNNKYFLRPQIQEDTFQYRHMLDSFLPSSFMHANLTSPNLCYTACKHNYYFILLDLLGRYLQLQIFKFLLHWHWVLISPRSVSTWLHSKNTLSFPKLLHCFQIFSEDKSTLRNWKHCRHLSPHTLGKNCILS